MDNEVSQLAFSHLSNFNAVGILQLYAFCIGLQNWTVKIMFLYFCLAIYCRNISRMCF